MTPTLLHNTTQLHAALLMWPELLWVAGHCYLLLGFLLKSFEIAAFVLHLVRCLKVTRFCVTANKISRCFHFHKPQIWTGTVLFSSVVGLNQNWILQENTMENKKVIALYLTIASLFIVIMTLHLIIVNLFLIINISDSKIHQQICSTDQSQNHPKLQVSNEAQASVLLLTKSDYQISLK